MDGLEQLSKHDLQTFRLLTLAMDSEDERGSHGEKI